MQIHIQYDSHIREYDNNDVKRQFWNYLEIKLDIFQIILNVP